MSYILYINGNQIELSDNKPIAQTKQVNDIARLDSRQTNFTNKFTVPPTPNNVKAMNKLYLVGNQSNVPYQKNTADLFDAETGLCMIYKGHANISQTTNKGYEIHVYDGNIDFYRSIENQTMNVLDLTDIKHDKTTATVVNSFTAGLPYKYILADYNGKSIYDMDKINIDYLVPSVKASFLWDQLFEKFGYTYSGDIFSNPDFTELWMSYPKGMSTDLIRTDIFKSTELFQNNDYLKVISNTLLTDIELKDDSQTFKTNVDIVLIIVTTLNATITGRTLYHHSAPINVDLILVVSGTEFLIENFLADGTERTFEKNIKLNAGDSFYFKLKQNQNSPNLISVRFTGGGFKSLNIEKVNTLNIDFIDELSNISCIDFFNEILWRFGLSLFKDKYTNHYRFKTVSELVNGADVIDWSSKFCSKEGEKYILNSYAQRNIMKSKYNDSGASYFDGSLLVNNPNLEAEKTIIQSKIYSPEKLPSNSLGFQSKVYKLWNKEVKDDGTVEYKDLQNRFYFLKSINKAFSSVTIGSEKAFTSAIINMAPVENYNRMPLYDIISDYYLEMGKILNKSLIITASMWIKNKDVNDIDFSKIYYIEQLGGSFLLNKIPNYLPGKKTSVELIRLNYSKDAVVKIHHYSSEHYSGDHYSTTT